MIKKKDILLKVKEYRFAIIVAMSIIILGSILFLICLKLNKNKIKEFKNEYYTFKYNTAWKLKNNDEKSILLTNNKNASIDIEIISLEDEYRYLPIEDLLDELLYNLQNQNKDYKLLFKEAASVTKNNYKGYKMLYENGQTQVMLVIYKRAENLVICKYEANNSYFDILLDSAQNIIYNFDLVDKQFELTYKLQLDEQELKWNNNQDLASQLKDTEDYEIADKNYLVNFSVPSNFELNEFNSTSKWFIYKGLSQGDLVLYTHIYNQNIYEYIGENGKLYTSYNYMKSGTEYSNFQENIKKMDIENIKGYIYKNSYTFKSYYGDNNYEEVVLIYELDASHIFTIELKSSRISIPEELVSKIKMNSSKNYASYVKNKVENGSLISELKEFTGYEKDETQVITLKIPQKYKEIDKGFNIYTNRNYGLGYNEDLQTYKYDVQYEMCSSMNSKLEILDSNYSSHKNKDKYKKLEYKKTVILNGKTFDLYEGGYTDISGALFSETNREYYYVNSVVLFYKLDTEKVLSIEIKGNDVEISNEVLNELTNFDIKKSKEKGGAENEL